MELAAGRKANHARIYVAVCRHTVGLETDAVTRRARELGLEPAPCRRVAGLPMPRRGRAVAAVTGDANASVGPMDLRRRFWRFWRQPKHGQQPQEKSLDHSSKLPVTAAYHYSPASCHADGCGEGYALSTMSDRQGRCGRTAAIYLPFLKAACSSAQKRSFRDRFCDCLSQQPFEIEPTRQRRRIPSFGLSEGALSRTFLTI